MARPEVGARRGFRRRLRSCAVALALAASCGCPGCAAPLVSPAPVRASAGDLGVAASACGCDAGAWSGTEAYWGWYHAIVLSRVREVEVIGRDPESFGPWQARDELDASEASQTGELTRWQVDYFITHNWSEYGWQILEMQGGDRLTINGQALEVHHVVDYPKDSVLGEVYELADEDDVILQTCVPSSSYNRLVFCRKV